MSPELQTIIVVITNLIVGYILYRQIKSQKDIIKNYKGLVEATNPDKIIALQKREIEQLTTIASNDKTTLQNQVFELTNYAVSQIQYSEWIVEHLDPPQPELFNRISHINTHFPNSAGILNKLMELRQQAPDSIKA